MNPDLDAIHGLSSANLQALTTSLQHGELSGNISHVIQIAEVLAVAGLDSGLLRFVSLHVRDPLRQRAVIWSFMGSITPSTIDAAEYIALFSSACSDSL